MTTIAQLGEFGLIARLTADLPSTSDVVTGVRATAIGTIHEGRHSLLFRHGVPAPLAPGGWDHLGLIS